MASLLFRVRSYVHTRLTSSRASAPIAVVERDACPSTAAIVGSATPAVTARDTEAVPQAPRARLGALDAGAAQDGGHLAVRRLAGDGPTGAISRLWGFPVLV